MGTIIDFILDTLCAVLDLMYIGDHIKNCKRRKVGTLPPELKEKVTKPRAKPPPDGKIRPPQRVEGVEGGGSLYEGGGSL